MSAPSIAERLGFSFLYFAPRLGPEGATLDESG